jgi:pimeloyl-ACP methyl ester carboxylesterase
MHTVTSADGTKIVYDTRGAGPAVVLVDPALNTRWSGSKPELADALAQQLTVYCYDRRGRGDSGDTLPYELEREIEDIDALIEVAGAPVFLYGFSSGACLAFEAALRLGTKVTKLALYEPPYDDDPAAQSAWRQYRSALSEALSAGRRGDAVAAFMRRVGMPAEQIAGMRQSPFWPSAEAIAPTLAYDAAAMGEHATVPTDRASRLDAPALIAYGTASFPFMATTARALSDAMPRGESYALDGQTHDVKPDVTGPVLVDFFLR